MTDAAEVQRLQQDLARAFFLALAGEDWVGGHLSRLEVAGAGFGSNHLVRADGSEDSVPLGRSVRQVWPVLREAMSGGERGAWLSAELEITPQGRFGYDFNWDRRPWMNTRTALLDPPEHRTTGPSDEDWREDLLLHPRSPERTPDWLAAIAAAGPPPPVPGPEVDEARMRLRFAALLAQPGWSDLGDAVLRHTVERLRAGEWIRSDPTDLPEGDPEIERLVQEVVGAVGKEHLDAAPSERVRALRDGALAAGVPPKVLEPDVARTAGAPSERIVRDGVLEMVARLTEALVDRD